MIAYTEYLIDPRVRREAECLADRGDNVDFLCLRQPKNVADSKPAQWETIDGVRVCHLPMYKYQGESSFAYLLSYIRFFFLSFWYINGLYFRKKYDVIHVNNMPDFLVFTTIIPRILRCKVILDIHDLTSELYGLKFESKKNSILLKLLKIQEALSLRYANKVLTVHEPYRRKLMDRKVPENKITVLLNTPDEKLFSLQDYGTRKISTVAMKNNTQATIVYHGTIVERYGIQLIIQALAYLRIHEPDLHINAKIYGRGEFVPQLRELNRTLNTEDIVYIHGKHIPLTDVPDVLIEGDIAVVPNIRNAYNEYALSTKLLEYISVGIPAIVSYMSINAEYFDNEMVVFFESGNVAELAKAISYLTRNPAKRRAMAQIAHQRFVQKYSWAAMKLDYYKLVDTLAGRDPDYSQPSQGKPQNQSVYVR